MSFPTASMHRSPSRRSCSIRNMLLSSLVAAASFLGVSVSATYAPAAPPARLPVDGVFQLKTCVGVTRTLDATGPMAFLFLDADSEFSRTQYRHFAQMAEIFPKIHFVAILSFGLGWDPDACSKFPQPSGSPASLLLDHHTFYGNQYGYEFFSVSPNELVIYNNKRRFRYLPKTQADMGRPIGHTWVHTAVEELDRVLSNPEFQADTHGSPLFLQSTFQEFDGFLVEGGEIGRVNGAHDAARCQEKCFEQGCTAFVMYGQHHCVFFASEPTALLENRLRYSNARLFIRQPMADVNKSQKILKGFLWAMLIIFGATLLFFTCTKLNSKRVSASVLDSLEANTGLSSLIRAAEQDDGEEVVEKFPPVALEPKADVDPAE
ncbi:unnamed protein product [Amoebophrya sp. A25]|nr:unnamed protein product [Amoebophrya sp. A25]|eukprot:GSA25T00026064001.1